MDPKNMYKTPLYIYIFFSTLHGIFSKISHKVGNKVRLHIYNKIDVTPLNTKRMLWIKTVFQQQKKKLTNTWKLKNSTD